MEDLQDRDMQLYADLERAFPRTSFTRTERTGWMSFDRKQSLPAVTGDASSIQRLVRAKKITYLGVVKDEPHFVIKSQE
jgi:hypothetical protein